MAKGNYVMLYGQVAGNPRISVSPDRSVQKAAMSLKILRRFNREMGKSVEFATPSIMTANKELVEQISNLKMGDMCLIKGVITTLDKEKGSVCSCGHTTMRPGTYSFITPIYIEKMEDVAEMCTYSKNKEQAIVAKGVELLKEKSEISNCIHVIGTLCREPEFFESENGRCNCSYQIAVNRRFRIVEGDTNVKTDYPWVRSFGETARENIDVLNTNSTVFIDGSVFTKIVKREIECENCGQSLPFQELAIEIHPYSVEYLHNCNLPEAKYTEE